MKILMIFAGQGYSQTNLFDIFKSDQIGKAWLNTISEHIGFSITENMDKLVNSQYTQIFISAYQLGIASLLKDTLQPHCLDLAGYSLGEVNAYLYSTESTLTEAMNCIKFRTEVMTSIMPLDNPNEFDLISLKGRFQLKEIAESCQKHQCHVAIVNASDHVIVGGKVNDLKSLVVQADAYKIDKSKFLSIHLPSHTPFYLKQSDDFNCFMQKYFTDKKMKYPIISALGCNKVKQSAEEINLLSKSLSETLNWQGVNQLIPEYGYDLMIDLGPGDAMSKLYAAVNHGVNDKIISVTNYKTIKGVRDAIQKVSHSLV